MLHDKIYNDAREIYQKELELDSVIKDLNQAKDELVNLSIETRSLLPVGFSPVHEEIKGHSPYAEWLMMMTEEQAVGFYFDDTVTYDTELAETGIEFLKNGLLNIPFTTIFFSCKNYFTVEDDNACELWIKYAKDKNIVYFSRINAIKEGELFFELDLNNFDLKCRSKEKKHWPILNDEIDATTLGILCHLLMTINHPAYEKVQTDISEAVNKKRERKGKGKLSPYIYIRMKKEYKDRLSSFGYTVKPHWRRGHVRNLGDGRIVPVQACIVNFDGISEPKKKTYIVGGV